MNKLMGILAVLCVATAVTLVAPIAASKFEGPKAVYVPTTKPTAKAVASIASPVNTTENLEVVELTEANSLVFDQAFNDQSVSALMVQAQALADKQGAKCAFTLVMNTPGGSIDAGLRLISFIKGLNCRVKTLTLFSASMGFMTVQSLDERLILDTGTLMSHRAKFGVSGEAGGEMATRYNWTMRTILRLETIAANRMQMPLKTYQELIRDEYFVDGQDAVRDHAADRAVYAKCGQGLTGTKVVTVPTMFGAYDVELSKCPLVPGFLKATPQAGAKPEGLAYVKQMFGDRRSFVDEYIVTNKWMKYQK